jgi:hypothetical protein
MTTYSYTGSDGDKTAIDNISSGIDTSLLHIAIAAIRHFLLGRTVLLVCSQEPHAQHWTDRKHASSARLCVTGLLFWSTTTRETATRIRYFLVLLGEFFSRPNTAKHQGRRQRLSSRATHRTCHPSFLSVAL